VLGVSAVLLVRSSLINQIETQDALEQQFEKQTPARAPERVSWIC